MNASARSSTPSMPPARRSASDSGGRAHSAGGSSRRAGSAPSLSPYARQYSRARTTKAARLRGSGS